MHSKFALAIKQQFNVVQTLDGKKEGLLPEFIKSMLEKCFDQLKDLYKTGRKNMDLREDVIILRETIYKLLLIANDCEKNLQMN
jgi:hypothetical protein